MGSGPTLASSQCSISLAGSSITKDTSGNGKTLKLYIDFLRNGLKHHWMWARDRWGIDTPGWLDAGVWTEGVSAAPSTVSATQISGAGATATFQYVFSDPDGHGDITAAQVNLHGFLEAENSCYFNYWNSALFLLNDAGTAFLGPAIPGAPGAVLENNQCRLDVSQATIVRSGNNLTLTVPVTAKVTGLKKHQMYVQDAGGLSAGWNDHGTWNPGNVIPTVDSVAPLSYTGTTNTFVYTASDADGFPDLNSFQVVVNDVLSGSGACYLNYLRWQNKLYLMNDAGTQWLGPITPGSGDPAIENSKCRVDPGASSASASANTVTLSLRLTYKVSGVQTHWLQAEDAAQTLSTPNWQSFGSSWTVP